MILQLSYLMVWFEFGHAVIRPLKCIFGLYLTRIIKKNDKMARFVMISFVLNLFPHPNNSFIWNFFFFQIRFDILHGKFNVSERLFGSLDNKMKYHSVPTLRFKPTNYSQRGDLSEVVKFVGLKVFGSFHHETCTIIKFC